MLAAEDLGWSTERLTERLANVVETLDWQWDPARRMLLIPDWWVVNRPANPNVFKSCLEDLRGLPPSHLVEAFCSNTTHLSQNFAKLLPNVSANVTPNCPTHEQEQDQEQEPPPPTPSTNTEPVAASMEAAVVEILLEQGMGKGSHQRGGSVCSRWRVARRAGITRCPLAIASGGVGRRSTARSNLGMAARTTASESLGTSS